MTCLVVVLAFLVAGGIASLTRNESLAVGGFFGTVIVALILSLMNDEKTRQGWRENAETRKGVRPEEVIGAPYPNYEIPDDVRYRKGDYSTQYSPPKYAQIPSRFAGKPTMGYWDIRHKGKMLLVRTIQNVENSSYKGPIPDLLNQYYERQAANPEWTDEEKDNMKAIVDYAIRYWQTWMDRGPKGDAREAYRNSRG